LKILEQRTYCTHRENVSMERFVSHYEVRTCPSDPCAQEIDFQLSHFSPVKRLLFHDYLDAAISRVFLARQQRIDSNGVSYQLMEANPQDYNGKCKIS